MVYCRYLFPREQFIPTETQKGQVRADPYRQNLLNLFLARNDPLINNFEEHLLLMTVATSIGVRSSTYGPSWSISPNTRPRLAKPRNISVNYSVRLQQRSVSSRRKMASTTSGDARS